MTKVLPKVSIIMNCFNGEKYLEESIRSAINQTYENWEIIFWDNLSQDNSKDIFMSFKDPRLFYYQAEKHTPLYEARNMAINKANGSILAFLDVDDYWRENKLEEQVPLFEDPSVGFACSNYEVQHDLKNKSWVVFKKDIPSGFVTDNLLASYFIGLLTLMIRKEAYDSLEYGFDPLFNIMGDLDMTIRLSMEWKLGTSQKVLAVCRKHGNNALVQERDKHINELEYWIDKAKKEENIKTRRSFHKLKEVLIYQKIIFYTLERDFRAAFLQLKLMSFGIKKLRAFMAILMPTKLLRILKKD
ncbi:glycosyltransferase [SAR86 cluster bacterium]|nr:glycosyltransferase [SAR86 cluster bacterium]